MVDAIEHPPIPTNLVLRKEHLDASKQIRDWELKVPAAALSKEMYHSLLAKFSSTLCLVL